MQGPPRLTIEERILLVLVEHLRSLDEFQVPPVLTQEGLSELLNVNRPNIARSLKALKRKGLVMERLSHVTGQRRRKKVYLVSPDRTETALRLRSELGATKVNRNGKDMTLVELGAELKTSLIEAYMFASGQSRTVMKSSTVGTGSDERYFIGRDTEVHRVMEWLMDDLSPIAVVCGMGGIGKTALLKRICGTIKDRKCLWFRFTEGSSFKGSLHSLEMLLESPGLGNETEPMNIALRLARSLSKEKVLVLDDLHLAGKDMENVLSALIFTDLPAVKLMAATRKRRTFYTARETSVQNRVLEVQLEGLDEKDSLELLRRRGFDEASGNALFRMSKGYPITLLLTPVGPVDGDMDIGPDAGSFFVSEVLNKLGPDELKALRTLSALRSPSAKARSLLTFSALDPSLLDELVSRSLVSWGTQGYEVHPVISDMVRSRTHKDDLMAMHSTIARFFMSEDRTIPGTIEALYHLSRAGKIDELLSLLKEKGLSILDEGYLELLVVLEGVEPAALGEEGRAWFHLLMGAGEYGMSEPARALNELKKASSASTGAALKGTSFKLSLFTLMGRVLLDLGSYKEAEAWFRRAESIYDPSLPLDELDALNITIAMNGLGLALKAAGDLKGALKAFESALARCDDQDPGNMAPSIGGNIASVLLAGGEPRKALLELEKALRISDGLRDRQTSARLHETMGEACAKMGEAQRAAKHFELALELSSSGEELRKASELYLTQAAQLPRAHPSFGLRIAAFVGASTTGDTGRLARTYNRICRIEREKDLLPSTEFHRKAAMLFKRSGMDRMAGKALNNLAFCMVVRGHKEDGARIFKEAIEVLRKAKDRKGEALTMNNLANVMDDIGEHEAALKVMTGAIHLMEENGLQKEARDARATLRAMKTT